MKGNFIACLAETLKHEGGWSDHPQDPGGATMKGVTLRTYRQWYPKATKDDLRKISDADLQKIYRTYWDDVRGDDLPAGLDLVAFDAAVNSGASRSIKWLQTALACASDGKMGPVTLSRANTIPANMTIDQACYVRLSFLKGLNTWPTFGKGWTARVDSVKAAALAMAHASSQATPTPGKPTSPPTGKNQGLVALIIAALAALAAYLGWK